MIIAIDFDGTIVSHVCPGIGRPNPSALRVMHRLIENGHQIILWTMRSGGQLKLATDYLHEAKIDLLGINENPAQKFWTESPKAYADLYIDDAALGCPMRPGICSRSEGRKLVCWLEVERILEAQGVLTQ